MDGQHYALIRNNLKFSVLHQQGIPWTENLPPLISKLRYGVYLNLLADIGYVVDNIYGEVNPLNNRWVMGTGLGLDFITNYDTVFRIEYSIHPNGQPGLYVHLNKSI